MSRFDLIDRLCCRRMYHGKKEHGLMNLEADPGYFPKELEEELLDGINYCRWAKAKGQLPDEVAEGIVFGLKNMIRMVWMFSDLDGGGAE